VGERQRAAVALLQGPLPADPAHPTTGALVCVEKVQAKGAQYPSYQWRLGREPVPADEAIAKMDATELSALVPLEDTIRVLSPDEEWERLTKVIDPATVEQIRVGL